MKFNAQYVIPIVILVVVVIISLCESCAYFKPYDSEGYESINAPLSFGDFDKSGSDANAKHSDAKHSDAGKTMDSALSGGTPNFNGATPVPGLAGGSISSNNSLLNGATPIPGSGTALHNTLNQAASAPVVRTTFQGREGFATLNDVSADYAKGDKGIDIYSQAKGGLSCDPGPYSNSTGYLCLNEMQQAQLKTRGGNQTEHN